MAKLRYIFIVANFSGFLFSQLIVNFVKYDKMEIKDILSRYYDKSIGMK